MKAMLRSDLLNFRQSAKSIVFLVLFFGGMAVFTQTPSFFGILLITLCLTVPFHLFSYDAACGWDRLTLSLPVSRASVILSKYVLCAGILAVLLSLCTAAIGLTCLVDPTQVFPEQMSAILACAAATMFMLSVLLPTIVRFGVTKGRYILMAVVWVPMMLVFLLKNSGMANPFPSAEVTLSRMNLPLLALSLLLATCLLYMLSALIAVAIFRRKEF